jgi:hypothetical protein
LRNGESAKCAARSAAVRADFGVIDADLAEVIDVWATLPKAVRADILAAVRQRQTHEPEHEV